MREELKDRVGRRGSFTATFKRTGIRKNSFGVAVTVLFIDLRDEAGTLVTDHLWFLRGKQMDELKLQPGERISFEATVTSYYKRAPRDGADYPDWDDDAGRVEKDYKLIYPTRMKRVGEQGSCKPRAASEQMEMGF